MHPREVIYLRPYRSSNCPRNRWGFILFYRPADTRTGFRIEKEQLVKIGDYKTLDVCKRDVGRVGGSCGRNCLDYGSGLIANCDTLVTVPKSDTR